jgi:hypothetical protein
MQVIIGRNAYEAKANIMFNRGAETEANVMNMTLMQLEIDLDLIDRKSSPKKVKFLFDSLDLYVLYDLLTLSMEQAVDKHSMVFQQNNTIQLLQKQKEAREQKERDTREAYHG